jgi:TRAP-type C4-dicarboxylate transport system permease small subunit
MEIKAPGESLRRAGWRRPISMDRFLRGYWRLLAGIGALEQALGVLLIANIVLNIGAQVFSRYVLGLPLVWVEEMAVYSFIWGTFIGASLGLKRARHIRIATFVGALPPRPEAWLRALAWALILALMVVLMVQARIVMGVEGRSMSVSLPVVVPRSWFYSVPLFIGCASMALTSVYFVLAELWSALHGRPVDATLEPEPAEP